ncbi:MULTISPECIES: HDOD domain-containing protein [Undibacterium]|uniref:HDOD domain-containing protein n=1 Tax=Undibacterium umbellatum TaxID=2762300 RepID=A0ABR6ZGW1_9BURK|nr:MULTISPECIES: HDOD domain-containing protein [Undibacterium]MBC3910968.1 HDOD domain-containing protein [Undibacterium umbellatum]MDP1977065.1 HDOD domain-containing protein [Undibacterium sp.]
MDRLEIFKSIAAEVNRGDIVFPTNVEASLKLQRILDDPDCHIDTAAKLIMADPLLSARTVAIANSAAYRRSTNEITHVRLAVNRLGFRTLKAMLAAVIVRQLNSKVTDPVLKAKADRLWEHSAHVSSLAQVIAKQVTRVDPETAMFAGIVHEIGGFYLISRAEEFPGLLDGEPEIWIEYGERMIGRGIMRQLNIPESVMNAVEAMWHGVCAFPPESLGDTLILANDIAPVLSPLHDVDREYNKRFARRLNFDTEDSSFQIIMEEQEEQIDTLATALMM